MPWDPGRYHQFQEERFAPFDDLMAMIRVRSGLRVIDLGCGTGELTRRLADALPESQVVGIDSSAEMLHRAQSQARPGLRFEARRMEEVVGSWDLVFSHAAIQWVDMHRHLVPFLLGLVAPGGQLAVQLPANHQHASHRLIHQTADEEPFLNALAGWVRESPVLSLDKYAEILHQHGGRGLTVLAKVYPHILPNTDAIADWMAGTALVPYLERLPADLHDLFMASYRAKLRRHWPDSPVFFGFQRILFAAHT